MLSLIARPHWVIVRKLLAYWSWLMLLVICMYYDIGWFRTCGKYGRSLLRLTLHCNICLYIFRKIVQSNHRTKYFNNVNRVKLQCLNKPMKVIEERIQVFLIELAKKMSEIQSNLRWTQLVHKLLRSRYSIWTIVLLLLFFCNVASTARSLDMCIVVYVFEIF